MAVFSLLGVEHLGQAGQRFSGIDRAGRIVRGVDEHGRGSGVERLLERVEVDLEVLGVGRNDGQVRAGAVHIRLVFREVRGEGDHFVARLGHHAQRMRQRAGRTRGREDVVGGVVHVEAAVEAFGDRLAHRRNAQGRRIAVQRHRFGRFIHVDHGVGIVLRARHARVAQRIVEHVLVADFGATRGRVFAQLADYGFSAEHGLVVFVDHGTTSLSCCCIRLTHPERAPLQTFLPPKSHDMRRIVHCSAFCSASLCTPCPATKPLLKMRFQ